MGGAVLFEGEAGLVSFSTVPFYGGGMRLFPFAGTAPRGLAHLRIANINPAAGALQLSSIWKGHYRNPEKVLDFLVGDVLIETDRPVPLQHSGEAAGEFETLRVRVRGPADSGLDIVDAAS